MTTVASRSDASVESSSTFPLPNIGPQSPGVDLLRHRRNDNRAGRVGQASEFCEMLHC